MTDDAFLAEMLGEAPRTPDPGFRIEVLARVAQRRQRRAALMRAAYWIVASLVAGLVFALAGAFGMSTETVQVLGACFGAVILGYLVAQTAIHGPRAALSQPLVVRF
jgi:peptidoglycan/LPS O-acetylase OafA/YrhL